MTDKLTRITLPTADGVSLMDWGECSPKEMIAQLRCHAKIQMEQAQAVFTAADADFQIDVVKGSVVQHHFKELQKSKISP